MLDQEPDLWCYPADTDTTAHQGLFECSAGCGAYFAGISRPVCRLCNEQSESKLVGELELTCAVACTAQLSVCTGSLVAFVIGLPYASKTAYALNIGGVEVAWWRAMQALGILPALLQVPNIDTCQSFRLY